MSSRPGMNIQASSRRRMPSKSPDFAFSPMSPDDDNGVEHMMLLSSGSGQDGDFSSGAPEISPNEIKRGKKLGKGSFAQVFAGMCRGLPVAVKVLNATPEGLTSSDGLRKFKDEIAVHQRLYHPNIVLLMGACTTGDKLMIVQELMHKDLERVLFDPSIKLSVTRRVEFGRQVALGMNWLHKLDPPVLHRDLKPSNCLLDREMLHLKIADFGLSSILPNHRPLKDSYGPRGTANYLAPEVLEGKEVTTAADVFAYGILLWQILSRTQPYADLGTISIDGFTDFIVDDSTRPPIEESQRKDYPIVTDLIERCWNGLPWERPHFDEVCEILSDAMVEIAIPHDSDAQSFWLKFFQHSGPSGVKIERVIKALLKWYRYPVNAEMRPKALQTQISFLETLMKEREDDEETTRQRPRITAEWFGNLVNWFGPLDGDFFKRVSALCTKPWFHGHLSGAQATRLLNGRADGFYLVRFSGTEAGYFTISAIRVFKNLKLGGKVTHVRIMHEPCSTSYTVSINRDNVRPSFKSLSELLEKEKSFLELTVACPGSPFAPTQDVPGYLGLTPIELDMH